MSGRGAWPTSGAGGTFKYLSDMPGPYYYIGSGVVTDPNDVNQRAVHGAVRAYQVALNKRVHSNLTLDGILEDKTSAAIEEFQVSLSDAGVSVWGGIGPETSKALLYPSLSYVSKTHSHAKSITRTIVCGLVYQESRWDDGAVGFVDPHDVGLVQVNGEHHPDASEEERLTPNYSFRFAFDYLTNAVRIFKNLDVAIASYNLGIGGVDKKGVVVGARAWLADGMPDVWTPPGQTTPRKVREYITTVRTACAS